VWDCGRELVRVEIMEVSSDGESNGLGLTRLKLVN